MHPLSNWQIEHQMPRSRGGGDEIENLVPSCPECNALKGKRTVEEYRHALKIKMEHAITAAVEVTGEIEGLIGWDAVTLDGTVSLVPPEWLCEIESLLSAAANKSVDGSFRFHGEQQPSLVTPPTALQSALTSSATTISEPSIIDETETVI
jgi:hypothetical protein